MISARFPTVLLLTWLLFASPSTVFTQEIGVPTPVSLPSGSGILTLDFSDRDYQLILYSARQDEPDTSNTYQFTVSAPLLAKPAVHLPPGHTTHDEAGFKTVLREEERALTEHLNRHGKPSRAKQAIAFQVGATRTFVFEGSGNVSTQTITATLAATSTHAEAWIDNNTSAITSAEAQVRIDDFSNDTFPIITSVFGAPSDVDGNGKVLFLYTELIDQVGGVSGFYRARSLFSESDGGDGNAADMMYLGVDHSESFSKSLLAHEFQHLINYNQHVLVRDGTSEISSINEALSHIAEDLVDEHVEGGNVGNVRDFAEAPSLYSILPESAHANGSRGTAYTFARSMMESFGSDIPTRLTQTSLSGVANVEDVSGQSFRQVYETYLSRMFLAGSGLNNSYEFAYPFFVDPATGGRSLAILDEHALNPSTTTVTGSTKAYASASIRLMGTGNATIEINTDITGEFHGILIPIPTDFQHNVVYKPDYFAGVTFSTPVTGSYTTGEQVIISGTVADPTNTEVLFRFNPVNSAADTLRFGTEGFSGDFSFPVLIPHTEAGSFTLSIFAGPEDHSLPFVGRIPNVTVAQGSGIINIPKDFFPGITLVNDFPGEFSVGDGITFEGSVSDPSVSQILFRFEPRNRTDTTRVFVDVSNGSFSKGFVFRSGLSDDYDVAVFAGTAGQSLGFVDGYSFVTIRETGFEQIRIPANFFSNITLDAPAPTAYFQGLDVSISGSISTVSSGDILFRFDPSDGSEPTRFFADIVNGRFTANITPSQIPPGTHELVLFAGSGSSLPFAGSFESVTVSASQPRITLAETNLVWPTTDVGSTSLRNLAVSNVGATDLVLSSITIDSDAFSVSNSSLTVSQGGTTNLPITFSPAQVGQVTGFLSFNTNDPNHAQIQIHVAGIGLQASTPTPQITLSNTTLSYGTTEVGASSSISVTVQNPGDADLVISELQIDGPFATSATPTTVAASNSLAIAITFTPTSPGTSTGSLTLVNNAGAAVQISLTGVGQAPIVSDPTRVPVDAFSGILLTTSPQLSVSVGIDVTIAGDVTDTSIGLLLFQFMPVNEDGSVDTGRQERVVVGTITNDAFSEVFSFAEGEEGGYNLSVFGGNPNAITLPSLGVHKGLIVLAAGIDPPAPLLVGDLDGNGSVDFTDFLSFAGAFGSIVGDDRYLAVADLDSSGSIDFTDFLTFAGQFGKST